MPNILIVEDSIDLKHIYVQLFAMYKYDVTTLSSSQNIEGVIEEFKPDVILLDIYLGCEDGRDICKELKQTHKSIPIIMVSVCMGLKESATACGADDYVVKPFDIDNLLNKVNYWAQKYQQLNADSTNNFIPSLQAK